MENEIFKNIYGCTGIKKELAFIKKWFEEKRKDDKVQLEKGILFYGSPGNGKTLFMRENAKSFSCPKFIIDESNAQTSKDVSDIFAKARKEETALVLIDELDLLCEDNPNMTRVLQEEMDGLTTGGNILILAATNSLRDISSPLKRPGRFGRIIGIEDPRGPERKNLFKSFFNELGVDLSDDLLEALNDETPYVSVVTIKSLVGDIYIRGQGNITYATILESLNRVCFDDFRDPEESFQKNYSIAIHEAGHCLLIYKYPNIMKQLCVQLYQDGGSTKRSNPSHVVESYQTYLADIEVALAGCQAEKLIMKMQSVGGYCDLNAAYEKAQELVEATGKAADYVPQFSLEKNARLVSETRQWKNEKKISRILKKAGRSVYFYLWKNKKALIRLADALYEKGGLNAYEINELLSGTRENKSRAHPVFSKECEA